MYIIKWETPYVSTVEADPVWVSQSVHQHTEVSLLKRVCDAHKCRPHVHTAFLCCIPAQVAMDDTVTVIFILGHVQRGIIWLGGTFGGI